jgi:hypothetical protein
MEPALANGTVVSRSTGRRIPVLGARELLANVTRARTHIRAAAAQEAAELGRLRAAALRLLALSQRVPPPELYS